MSELFSQLGINVKLLIAQAVNFGILLAVLTVFVYRPLVKLMNERRAKIEKGLENARHAQERLDEIDKLKEEKMREADRTALVRIAEAEKIAGVRGREIAADASKKAEKILADAASVAEHRKVQELENVVRESRSLVREALMRAVALGPKAVDDALISEAVDTIHSLKK